MDIRYIYNKVKKFGFKRSIEKAKHRFLFLPSKYYSELGEDVVLQHYCPKVGFYVDIGAYHPKRFSVTRMFYERGWRGINIEPNPYSKKIFDQLRRRDININIGVSDEVSELDYYSWGRDDTSNTFDYELYKKRCKYRGNAKEILKIKVDTLNNILDNNLPEGIVIDFLNIDVEGYEFKILKSLNYDKYSPKLILVEDLDFRNQNRDFMEFKDTKLYRFLNSRGYMVVGKIWYTILFRKKD